MKKKKAKYHIQEEYCAYENDLILLDYFKEHSLNILDMTPQELMKAKHASGEEATLDWCEREIKRLKNSKYIHHPDGTITKQVGEEEFRKGRLLSEEEIDMLMRDSKIPWENHIDVKRQVYAAKANIMTITPEEFYAFKQQTDDAADFWWCKKELERIQSNSKYIERHRRALAIKEKIEKRVRGLNKYTKEAHICLLAEELDFSPYILLNIYYLNLDCSNIKNMDELEDKFFYPGNHTPLPDDLIVLGELEKRNLKIEDLTPELYSQIKKEKSFEDVELDWAKRDLDEFHKQNRIID